MNKAQLTAQVAAKLSLPKTAANRMIDAVFSIIADSLAREERVSIAGSDPFATRQRFGDSSGRLPQVRRATPPCSRTAIPPG